MTESFLDNCTNVLVENVASSSLRKRWDPNSCPTLSHFATTSVIQKYEYSTLIQFLQFQWKEWTLDRGLQCQCRELQLQLQCNGKNCIEKPGVGVDIEYETAGGIRGGYFEDCQFLHNRNAGFICDAFSGGNRYLNFNHEFVNCTFKSSYDLYSVWPNTRSLKFNRCTFLANWFGYNSPIASP